MWKSIQDYEQNPETLATREIETLAALWNEQRNKLSDVGEFDRRINRKWAIETGLIERLYSLDRGTTEILIQRGLNSALLPHRISRGEAEYTIAMISDQQDAIEGIFSFVRQDRELSTSLIKELHTVFTRNQRTTEARDQFGNIIKVHIEPGQYKTAPNNPTRPNGQVHIYCPPEHVHSEMDRLIHMHREHQSQNISPEVEAAWLHHRFTQIHPFTDGNGRVARALATMVLIQGGSFPLVVRDEKRSDYIDALEEADRGKLAPLVNFFVSLLKQEFIDAFGVIKETERHLKLSKRLESIKALFTKSQIQLERELKITLQYANELHDLVKLRLNEIKEQLLEIIPKNFILYVHDADNDSKQNYYFRHQIIESARKLNYHADTSIYRSWVRLCIKDSAREYSILVSLHGIGYDFKGVLVCSVIWFEKVRVSRNESEIGDNIPLCKEVFLVNYKDDLPEVKRRFDNWLDAPLENGLAIWQNTIPKVQNHS
ncbi:MAG: Fic family protein [Rhodothermaceae bacterium]|nr:Fic family protein [Bacteroidota bacterium]MXW31720.1 Fic family protein [Rhodothermaceae bacterium]MDE2645504.1 Fic family protein [Bacteroidota bacterium]MXX97725.1 Fic family protein [Rhodothermaceae bacterium]MXZ16845.1 Fic family protein [Rhodothermaceae bacterium]